jgi:chromosomal replication initiator protein
LEQLWKKVKLNIRERIPSHSYRMWIEPLTLKSGEDGQFILNSPNSFSQKRVTCQYAGLIQSEFDKVAGKGCQMTVEVAANSRLIRRHEDSLTKGQIPLPNIHRQPSCGRLLRRDFTFDHFVVGGNNDFAFMAALSIASLRKSNQNPLMLLSNPGMGKSHLSQAVGHHIMFNHPTDRVYYTTAEDFANEMVAGFRTGAINGFKEKYRKKCDALILEDIHFLTGKERTQIELYYILESLLDFNKKIIFTSCYPPAEIPKLNGKLSSRFASSLISHIESPNFKTRVKILKQKSAMNGFDVPEDITQYLAGALTEDVRQLESGLMCVVAKASLLGEPMDLTLAGSVVKHMIRQKKRITINSIKKLVCKHYRITLAELASKSRKQSLVRPRQIAIYLARKYTDVSLQEIGRSFNRFHATAIHAINCVEQGLKGSGRIQKQVEYLSQKLKSGQF